MRIAIIQHDIVWTNPKENIRRIEHLIDRQPDADLYVLTEMFTTGFVTDMSDIAENDNGETLQWMISKAKSCQAAIAGSIAVQSNGKQYNRLYFVKPNGEVTTYDKRHLFAYGGEDKMFSRGEKRVVVEYKGVRFLLLVCFDLRFPVWSRYHDDYDAILYVANWPTCRIDSWDVLLKARAIENQCFVIGVNRVGNDPSCDYCGNSVVINPYGQVVTACASNQECSAVAEIDLQEMKDYREKFPIGEDTLTV